MGHLTATQRYEISALLQAEKRKKEICNIVGIDKSVLCREMQRNSDGRSGAYNPELAQRKYDKRMKTKPKHIRFTTEIKQKVIKELEDDLSPEQIVGRAKLDGVTCVSHETIYQFVWEDKKNKGQLYKHLRNRGKKYSKRGSYKSSRGIIKDRVSISERPAIVEEKVRIGDLEIDTIIGKNHSGAIFTATDRLSLMEWIVLLPKGKNALSLAEFAVGKLTPIKEILKTMTSDNGKEFAEHKMISQLLGVNFYFADPYKSCQRGLNENFNGLIRQYISKKTDFNTIDNKYIEYVENKLNNRPRKKLNFLTPNEYFLLTLKNKKVALVT
jgi:IS30 family transposase